MYKTSLSFFACLFFCSHVLFAQQKNTASKDIYTIPFELTEANNISIKAILNNTDTVRLMFHTAASSVMLIEETTQKIKSVHFERTDSVKSWGGSGNTSRYSKSNTLRIGALTWNNLPIWEDKNSGPKTDGKFGIDLFADKVIEIDFEKKLITLSPSLPSKAKQYEKLAITAGNDMMFVQASCKTDSTTVSNKFLIHSGYSGAVLLDDKFVADNKLGNQLTKIDEKSLKDSYGNVLKVKKAILPELLIGKEKLENVPVGFFEGAIGRQKMSIIGGDILKRFNIIIDAKREYIYMKANKLKTLDHANA
jgi:hypothetical protein